MFFSYSTAALLTFSGVRYSDMIVTDKVKNIPIIIGNKIINATPAPVEPTAPVAVAVAVTVEAPVVPAADELAAEAPAPAEKPVSGPLPLA